MYTRVNNIIEESDPQSDDKYFLWHEHNTFLCYVTVTDF